MKQIFAKIMLSYLCRTEGKGRRAVTSDTIHMWWRSLRLKCAQLSSVKELKPLTSCCVAFVSLPKLCDQAGSVNRSSRNYTPPLQIKYTTPPHAASADSLYAAFCDGAQQWAPSVCRCEQKREEQ